MGAASVGILHANNLQDIPIDSSRGAKTLASLLGFRRARFFLPFVYCVTFLALAECCVLTQRPTIFVCALFSLPMMIQVSKKVINAHDPSSPSLINTRVEAAKTQLLLGLCIGVGLLIDLLR
jgi:1,4-dihydroxy-2-naphthoate octaprenyltransferase